MRHDNQRPARGRGLNTVMLTPRAAEKVAQLSTEYGMRDSELMSRLLVWLSAASPEVQQKILNTIKGAQPASLQLRVLKDVLQRLDSRSTRRQSRKVAMPMS